MQVKTLSFLTAVVLAGCAAPSRVVVSEYDPYWDGHTFVTVPDHTHCVGCGHYYYDGVWNAYPADHVYVEPGYVRYKKWHG